MKWFALQWRHNKGDGVSNNQWLDCLLNRLLRRRWKKTSKLRVTGLWDGNSPMTGEFLAQRPRNAESVSIWWRHHVLRVASHYYQFDLPRLIFPYETDTNGQIFVQISKQLDISDDINVSTMW